MDVDDFLDEVDEVFICGICTMVLVRPRSCQEGHTYCQDCISTWLQSHSTCPIDRNALTLGTLTNNRPVQTMIQKLKVRCSNFEFEAPPPAAAGRAHKRLKQEIVVTGCPWTGTVQQRVEHLAQECDFEELECPHADCEEKMARRDLDAHTESCDYRMVTCEFCEEEMEHVRLELHQGDDCEKIEIQCFNECGASFPRDKEDAHLEECPKCTVKCPFAVHGCGVSIVREEYAAHQESHAQAHAELLSKKLAALENKRYSEVDLRWEITDIKEKLDKGGVFHSKAASICVQGAGVYKMSLSMDLTNQEKIGLYINHTEEGSTLMPVLLGGSIVKLKGIFWSVGKVCTIGLGSSIRASGNALGWNTFTDRNTFKRRFVDASDKATVWSTIRIHQHAVVDV